MSCRREGDVFHGCATTFGSTTLVFCPLSGPVELAQIDVAHAALELGQALTDAEVLPAVRYSNDGKTWTGTAAMTGATATSSAGRSCSQWTTLSSTYRYAQFGSYARNTGATTTRRKIPMILSLRYKAA